MSAERLAKSRRAGARRRLLWRVAGELPRRMPPLATRLVEVPLAFRDLPAALLGFRILHLSDLHLGAGPSVEDLRRLLDGLRGKPPDLIALTGDVADNVGELEAALQLLTEFSPRAGVYAALGNHEYLNDISLTLPVYRKSSVRLLINEVADVVLDGARLAIAGVDDPVFVAPPRAFFRHAVARSAPQPAAGAFRLLLCHRPEGFEAAAEHGFHLTLSGHTHGAQLGFGGQSALEALFGVPYQWGSYRIGESRLYTTSGFGHWFPLRLNCPSEAPIIVLERA
jgi:predicted MPP superfamily phosphohydrolase